MTKNNGITPKRAKKKIKEGPKNRLQSIIKVIIIKGIIALPFLTREVRYCLSSQ